MNTKYLIFCFLFPIITMHLLYGTIVRFTEVSSFIWSESRLKVVNSSVEILVLGDSQLLSGISADSISKLESISKEKILFMVRPSEQPEGMYDQYLSLKSRLPNLRKIYLNLSPISISQNSVTDAHRQLYLSFGKPALHQLYEESLRKAYFNNSYDILWKAVIEIFPFFGLNQNLSNVLGIAAYPSNMQEEELNMDGKTLVKMPTLTILSNRRMHNEFISEHFKVNEYWTWKNYGDERQLNGGDILPTGSSLVFMKERPLSIRLIRDLVSRAKKENIKIVCLDIPFSPELEKDIASNNVRSLLNAEIQKFEFEKVIRVDTKLLNQAAYFTDFTHLNSVGRDVLSSYLTKVKD